MAATRQTRLATARPGSNGTALLVLLTAANFLAYAHRQMVYTFFPLLKTEFSLSDFQLGLMGSVFVLVFAAVGIPLSAAGDKWGRGRMVLLSLGVWTGATMASAAATTYWELLIARALVAIGQASFLPCASALLSEATSGARRARVMSVFNLGIALGGGAGIGAGGVMAESLGWRTAMLLGGAPGMLLLACAYPLLRVEPPRAAHEGPHPCWKAAFTSRTFVLVLAGGAAATFALGGLVAWLPTYIFRVRGLTISAASAQLGAVALVGTIVGALAGGFLADHWGRRHPAGRGVVNAAGFFLGGGAALAALLAAEHEVFLLALLGGIVLFASTMGPTMAMIHDSSPAPLRARAVALYGTVGHLAGDALSPAIVGAVSDTSGLSAGMVLLPAASVLAGGFYLTAALSFRRHIVRQSRS
jgi:MFS family permease